MGVRFYCPNGHKLNVKEFQAGKRGICPFCGAKFLIPIHSTRKSSKEERAALKALATGSSNKHEDRESVGLDRSNPTQESPSQTLPATTALRALLDSLKTNDSFSSQSANPSSKDVDFGTKQGSSGSAQSSAGGSSSGAWAASTSGRMPDPFATVANVVWYVRPPTGGQFGPATANIVRHWLAEGRITPDSLVWREGWRDWQQASNVFPQLHVDNSPGEAGKETMKSVIAELNQQSVGQNAGYMQPLIVSVIIAVVVFFFGIIVWMATHRGPNTPTDNAAPTAPTRTIREIPSSPNTQH
jgi:hypothetical protein